MQSNFHSGQCHPAWIKPDARYTVIPHPLYSHFGAKKPRGEAEKTLGLKGGKKNILFFGLIREYKGLDILIDAFSGLDDSYQLIIAGEPYGSFEKYSDAIALSPLKAATLAHGMLQHARKAEKTAPDNPDVNIWSANILFYMPDVFGGNTQQSREYYRKALQLYENDESLRSNNWMYLQLIITLGLVEEKDRNYEKAHEYFSKAMQLYPEYPHLKNVLYPRILEELGNS